MGNGYVRAKRQTIVQLKMEDNKQKSILDSEYEELDYEFEEKLAKDFTRELGASWLKI